MGGPGQYCNMPTDKELNERMSLTWAEAAKTTLDMEPCRDLVGTLCATGTKWPK